jgi:hypothetical protein
MERGTKWGWLRRERHGVHCPIHPAAPAVAEVQSGWVGIAQKTGFGLVSPLPGIWPSRHLDTAISLPVGVEVYAAYALRAWLARDQMISDRTRRFASGRRSARSRSEDQDGPDRRRLEADRERPTQRDQDGPERGPRHRPGITGSGARPARPGVDQARVIARRLAAAGKPVSRRALRSGGVAGSNEALNSLARMINTELAGCADGGRPGTSRLFLPVTVGWRAGRRTGHATGGAGTPRRCRRCIRRLRTARRQAAGQGRRALAPARL